MWQEITADPGASYDEEILIDLDKLEPLIAMPHSPDNVVTVRELEGMPINQVIIGSCTNSSYQDLMQVANILRGKSVHPDVSLAIAPGSKQVLSMLAENGGLLDIINAGARILESACGPCIGMGQAPQTGGISLRTNNRNFQGRSGTLDSKIYLVSPETAAVSAIEGVLTDPRKYEPIKVNLPEKFIVNDNLLVQPEEDSKAEVLRGPNIIPISLPEKAEEELLVNVVLKVGDNITTDDIMPSTAKLLPYRSNIPYLSQYCFSSLDPDFYKRVVDVENGVIVAGDNYGQGSSREHAALVPRFLGIKAVIAKSFARIHYDNLINMGILPLLLEDSQYLEKIKQGDNIKISGIGENLKKQNKHWTITLDNNDTIQVRADFTNRQAQILLAGGLLNYTKKAQEEK